MAILFVSLLSIQNAQSRPTRLRPFITPEPTERRDKVFGRQIETKHDGDGMKIAGEVFVAVGINLRDVSVLSLHRDGDIGHLSNINNHSPAEHYEPPCCPLRYCRVGYVSASLFPATAEKRKAEQLGN
ncbi:hypothetical protein LZ32DRAFT_606349 [Colletotrichum eremochloae]|nr:hypothetical protein LZ32DRAFT_606349 [Colletotrichum eremochloae]